MKMTRIVTLAMAAAFALWTVVPALAQSKPADTTKLAEIKAEKDKDGKKNTKTVKKHARRAGGDKAASAALEHSNKGGQDRGLDRADKAAGERGEQGRDNARAKQTR